MFIGRTNEIKELREMFSTSKMEAALIYGRRRVGKTAIINEALKECNLKVIHYECKKVSIDTNLKMITELLSHELSLGGIYFKDFNAFFDYVFNLSQKIEFVLVIDEFTFLLEKDFSVESFLASAIDKYKEESKMKLIISGSYVGLIEKMLEYGSHSFGRYNHILKIAPFNYYDSALFYSNYSDEDKIIAYSVFGGLPYFNSLINPNISIIENIKRLILKKDSILEIELNQMILEETSKIENLNDAISFIAKGKKKQSDLNQALKSIGVNDPKYLLNRMIDMDIVEKYTPINDLSNKKLTFFRFKDNFFDFYYRYISLCPYSYMRVNPDLFYENFIKEDFIKEYIPYKFEEISKEFLLRLNINGKVKPFIRLIGKYFYNDRTIKVNREFDLVTLDENGYISYECKFTNSKINNKVVNEEINQTKNLDINFYKLGFISKNGFDAEVDINKYILYSLSDFYK